MSLGVAHVEFNLSSKTWEPLLEGRVRTWINKTMKCKGAEDGSILTLVITHELNLMWVVEKFTPAKGDLMEVAGETTFEGLEMPSYERAQELFTQFSKLHFETSTLPSIPTVTRELRRRTRSSFPRPLRCRPHFHSRSASLTWRTTRFASYLSQTSIRRHCPATTTMTVGSLS
jgi:hypothetical protein